jgi:hypothetical protein
MTSDGKSRGRIAFRLLMRVVMPTLMIGFAIFTIANEGARGLLALLPILAAHVVGFAVVFPLWVRYRRRREAVQARQEQTTV